MEDITAQLDALEREKAGYVLAEKPDRVKQVEAEVARLKKAQRSAGKETAAAAPAENTAV